MLAHFVKRPFFFAALAALAIVLGFGGATRADSISFNLDTTNLGSPFNTQGPYVSVTVNRTSTTTATLTFMSLTNSGNIYLLGDGGSAGANINATTFTVANITGTNAGTGFTPGPFSTDSGNEDGFGPFNLKITSFDGFTHSSDTISFDVTSTSGPVWNTASDVLTPNANNAVAAAHIFVTSSPADASNGAVITGFAAGNGNRGPNVETTPAPPGVVLLGTGIVLLGLVGWSRRRALGTAS